MTIDIEKLNGIRSKLEEAAQTIDEALTDCEHELEKCADALGEALEWLEESRKRHDKATTRIIVHADFIIDVKHPRSLSLSDVKDEACEYVREHISQHCPKPEMYADYVEGGLSVEPDVEVDE